MKGYQACYIEVFQSTPPMQGATIQRLLKHFTVYVSIHAPYAGSDNIPGRSISVSRYVSIHAPYAGSDYKRDKNY